MSEESKTPALVGGFIVKGGRNSSPSQIEHRPPSPVPMTRSPIGEPLPLILHCPVCGERHIDKPEPESGWTNPPHRSHLCASCGCIWRPADVPTIGVEALTTRGEADTWPIRHEHLKGPRE